ncbi:MAG: TPM domain-containing protein [Lentisphaeria bacterium]|nr:TPM domain-containing protein [Lentisphaeria bacterium]
MAQNDTGSTEDKQGIKFRLPRIGCFSLFFLFFVYILISLGFLCCTAFPPKLECETPTEHITVYDPCNVLHQEDRDALTKLANEVAETGKCDVALLFVNEQASDFQKLFNTVLYEWDTPKGVLLIYGLEENQLKMALKGGEWRLAGHDGESLHQSVKAHDFLCRGGTAKILLDDLNRSLEKANRSGEPGTVKEDFSGVYYDSMDYTNLYSFRVAGVVSFVLGLIVFLFGLLTLLGFRDERRKYAAEAPSILAEYERRHPLEPQLILKDRSAPEKPAFPLFDHPVLKILGIALGIYLAFLLNDRITKVSSYMLPDEETVEDVYRRPDIPDAAPSHLLDLADVFSTDEENALAETIEHLERNAGGQVRILTVRQLDGIPLEQYTLDVASKWKLGDSGKDNGALLFLAVKDRKNRIEVGYGWEGVLNDARCGDLLREAVPALRDERYADACAGIVRGMERWLVNGSAADAGQPRIASSITVAPRIMPPEPKHDPRRGDTTRAVLGILGGLASLLGILLFYLGCLIGTSSPHYEIIDPLHPKPYVPKAKLKKKDKGKSSGGHSVWSWFLSGSGSHSGSDSDSSSSRRSGGGGGSFGGGGASGGW